MSDSSQGPGWWQASDGKWYPPEQKPGEPASPAAGATGAREAKASAKAEKAHAKALRPWYKKKRFMIPLVLIVLIVIGGIAGGSAEDDDADQDVAASGDDDNDSVGDDSDDDGPEVETNSGNESNPPQADVEVARCYTDDVFGFMEAELTITNNSSERSNYLIEVVFESPDGSQKFSDGFAASNNVEPGQTATETSTSAEEAPGDFQCRVASVDRFAS